MVMARVPKSRIEGGIWADRVVEVKAEANRTKDYVFTKGRERQAKIADFEDKFMNWLEGLHTIWPGLFEPGTDIAEAYSLFRSLRRGSNTEAICNRLDSIIIDMNNRWLKFERARGWMPSLSQGIHARLWEYSHSL